MTTSIDITNLPIALIVHWMDDFGSWLHSDHRKFGRRGTLSVKSIENYLRDARHFTRFYEQAYGGEFHVGALTEGVVRAYFEWMDMNRVAPATFNRRLATMKLMSQWIGCGDVTVCVERKLTEYEPRDKTPEEYEALEVVASAMSHLKRSTQKHSLLGERDQIAMMLMGMDGGLRISEVEGLNVDDLNMARLQIRVRGKGGSDQRIEISDDMAGLLSRWIERMPKPVSDEQGTPLFVDWKGRRVTAGQLRRRLKLIGEKAGVDVTCHDLRATMGCQFYVLASQQMGSQYAAADATRRQMRHRDFRTTQKNYLRASRAQIRAVVEAM
jgi:integrase/recombinase XerC